MFVRRLDSWAVTPPSIALLLLITTLPATAVSIEFKSSDYVEYRQSGLGQKLYVWDKPCGSNLIGTVNHGASGQIKSGNHYSASCYGGTYDWYYTSFWLDSTGWVAGDFLVNNTGLLSPGSVATVRSTPNSSLFVWSQPGGGNHLGNLQPGTEVRILEEGPILDIFGGTYSWFRVDQGWVAGEFLQAGTDKFVPPPPPTLEKTSLIFVDVGDWKIPGLDHVGLRFGDTVYESTNFGSGGVIDEREPDELPGSIVELDIEYTVANEMTWHISDKLGSGYSDIDLWNFLDAISPDEQKGGDGTFTCVGLIEWAAEQVAILNGDQGFIHNDLEYISIDSGFLESKISTLTPNLLYNAVKHPDKFNSGGLHGLLDPVDFILTDPLGRRLGYTQDLGYFDEIEGAFYTGDGWAEQFFIPDLIPGDYSLTFFGLEEEAQVAFGNSTGGSLFSGYLGQGEHQTMTFTVSSSVPEPRSFTIVLALGALGFSSLTKRKA